MVLNGEEYASNMVTLLPFAHEVREMLPSTGIDYLTIPSPLTVITYLPSLWIQLIFAQVLHSTTTPLERFIAFPPPL